HTTRQRIAHRCEPPTEPPRSAEAREHVPEEHAEDRGPDEPRLDDQRDVERMRPPVRLPGRELVVDGERVQPEPEQRMRVEDLRDEVVDGEVRALGTATRLDA